MPDADELAELRTLQARAYGRDGGLTDAGAARLRELQGRGPSTGSGTQGEHDDPEPWVADPQARVADRHEWVAEPIEASGQAPSTDAGPQGDGSAASVTPARSLLRMHWRPVALAVAAVLVAGVGLGWVLFGRSAGPSVALTPEQQQWQNALLAEGIYDSGSVRAVAVEEGTVVWTATQDERERTCLILSNGGTTRPNCDLTESVEESGIWGSLVVEIGEDVRREVSAQVLFAPSGEPVVRTEIYDQESGASGMTYANENETKIAARLSEEGFDPNSIWVIGYDGAVPIWTALQLESQRECLIYDGSTDPLEMACDETQLLDEQGAGLVLEHTEEGVTTRFEKSPTLGPMYLVITREGGEIGASGD